MAGFDNIGSNSTVSQGTPQAIPAGYGVAPPNISPHQASGYMGIGVPNAASGNAGFMSGGTTDTAGADTTPQHNANVDMARMGLGDMGYGSSFYQGMPNYGFTSDIWNQINQFLSNPQSQGYTQNYQNIMSNVGRAIQGNPAFSSFSPTQMQNFRTNFPSAAALQYGLAPPSVFQNIGFPNWNLAQGLRNY